MLVTGSLYLLAELESAYPSGGAQHMAVMRARDRLGVVAFALVVVAAIVGIAFALGYILGKVLI